MNSDDAIFNGLVKSWFFVISILLLAIGINILIFNSLSVAFIAIPLLLLIIYTAVAGYYYPQIGLIIFVAVLAFQPILTMPLSHYASSSTIKLFVSTKELCGLAFFGGLLLKNRKQFKVIAADYGVMFFLLIYTMYIAYGSSAIFLRIVSYREGFMICLPYFIGRILFLDMKVFTKVVLLLTLAVILVGYFERFFLQAEQWEFIGNMEYIKKKYGDDYHIKTVMGIPVNWFLGVGSGSEFHWIRRIVGPMGEGTSFSRFVSFASLLVLFNGFVHFAKHDKLKVYWKLFALLAICSLMLSLGKGGIAIFIAGLGIWFLDKLNTVVILILSPFVLYFGIIFTFDLVGANILRHFLGLYNGIMGMIDQPFGHGLGSSGQLAVSFDRGNIEEKVSESYIGGLAYQIGVLGLISYLSAFLVLIVYFTKKYKVLKSKGQNQYKLTLIAISSLIGIFLTSILANSAISPVAAGIPMMFSGLLATKLSNLEAKIV